MMMVSQNKESPTAVITIPINILYVEWQPWNFFLYKNGVQTNTKDNNNCVHIEQIAYNAFGHTDG